MSYLNEDELQSLGFKFLGKNVKISNKASIYDPEKISIDDCSRIDDFCILSGNLTIGKYCHVTPMCLIAGGIPGVYLGDFCTLAYGVKVFSQSDDYSGLSMVNSLIPKKYKNEIFLPVKIEKQVVIGTNSVVFPGVTIEEGCAIGAMSLLLKSTASWGIYVGNPAYRLKDRDRNIAKLELDFLKDINNEHSI